MCTHIVAGAPSRLTRALRNPHTTAQNVLSHVCLSPWDVDGTLSALSEKAVVMCTEKGLVRVNPSVHVTTASGSPNHRRFSHSCRELIRAWAPPPWRRLGRLRRIYTWTSTWGLLNSEVDALSVITISRGCFERCCSNKRTPP